MEPGQPGGDSASAVSRWLLEHADDRARYAAAKNVAADAANAAGKDVAFYNQHKQAVIREILDRIFQAHHML